MYKLYLKRIFDISLSFILLIITVPVFFMVSVVIYCKMGRPILFSQIRPGKDAKLFKIYKFRTMNNMQDAHGVFLPDEYRLTRIGKFIRSTSLDEIPQLFNVLIGNMSFVGPRPLLIEYLAFYNDEQKRRHAVLPEITGWAQVNGRNAISWEEKFNYDVWYIDNQSFTLDMKILWMTFLKVIKRSGVSSGSSVTMEKFKGSK